MQQPAVIGVILLMPNNGSMEAAGVHQQSSFKFRVHTALLLVCCVQPEVLAEVVELLQNSAAANDSSGGRQSGNALQLDQITRVMRRWGQMNGIMV